MERLLLLTLSLVVVLCHEQFQVTFEWKSIDFQWPSEEVRKYAVLRGDYIASNNFITTVKFWKDKMYLTIPRWKDGVPVTLGVTSAKPVDGDTAPLLDPFPTWDMQKLGDCSAFQLVHSIEIDPKGRMWVLDTGRSTALSKENKGDCPARLVILDLEDNGKIIRTYEFPDYVARRGVTYLNDIVLDHENGGMAYITDNGRDDPGIIVYSVKNNTSWKIRHDSMKAKAEAVGFMVAKTHVISPVHVDGIALSPASEPDRQIYYSPLSSFHLYSIPVSAARDNATNIDQFVKELGRKSSQTDGMVMSATGVLYFGLLADDAIATWDTKKLSFTVGQRVISRDHILTQWPDSFSFDEDGNFWCVTNMLQNFLNNRVNIDVPNYRLIRTRVGVKSYQYYENGTAPEWPDFTAGAESVKFALASFLVVLLVFVAK
ncbi:Protein yellow [Camponotus japonicus]